MKVDRDGYMRAFGSRFKQAMGPYSYKAVASDTGIGVGLLYRYANGTALPSAFTLAKITAATGIDANALLGVRRR